MFLVPTLRQRTMNNNSNKTLGICWAPSWTYIHGYIRSRARSLLLSILYVSVFVSFAPFRKARIHTFAWKTYFHKTGMISSEHNLLSLILLVNSSVGLMQTTPHSKFVIIRGFKFISAFSSSAVKYLKIIVELISRLFLYVCVCVSVCGRFEIYLCHILLYLFHVHSLRVLWCLHWMPLIFGVAAHLLCHSIQTQMPLIFISLVSAVRITLILEFLVCSW